MKIKTLLLMVFPCVTLTIVPLTGTAQNTSANKSYYESTPRKAADIIAYNEALATNTVAAWNHFLKTYPNSLYKNNALKKRLEIIGRLYKEEAHGDGSFFDFHGPVSSVTEKMFYSDETVEYKFDEQERVLSGFTRDEKGRITDYATHTSTNARPYFTCEFEYGRVITFGHRNSPIWSQLAYNQYGLLIKEVIFNKREDAVIGRIEYTYTKFDDHGNWIERDKTVIKNAKIVDKATETRTITYWGQTPVTTRQAPASTSKKTVTTPATRTVAQTPAPKTQSIYKTIIAESTQEDVTPDFQSLGLDDKMKAIGRMYSEEMKGDGGFFDFHGKVKTIIGKCAGHKGIAEYHFNTDGIVEVEYPRDDFGHIKGVQNEEDGKSTKNSRLYFTCDSNGRLICYGYAGAPYNIRLRYNPYGLLTTEETYDINENRITGSTEYTYTKYDDHGNWTERSKTIVEKSKLIAKETETRKLTYWQ